MKNDKTNGLTLPDEFVSKALAIPAEVDALSERLLADGDLECTEAALAQMAAYEQIARRIKADTKCQNAIAYGTIRLKATAGELMPSQQGKELPLDARQSFNKNTIAQYRKLADHKDRFDEYRSEFVDVEEPELEITAAHFVRWIGGAHVAKNTGLQEWYTPPEYIEAAKAVMDDIDLDPASSVIAQQTVGALNYFTITDNGLAQDWEGRVWMNPPYGQPEIDQFCAKLCLHVAEGDISQACVLVNNATETTWFQGMLELAVAVCFVRGRIKYLDTSNKPVNTPLQGQAVLYFGRRVKRFGNWFGSFGKIATL